MPFIVAHALHSDKFKLNDQMDNVTNWQQTEKNRMGGGYRLKDKLVFIAPVCFIFTLFNALIP
jgi:hypothetical protein